MGVAIFCCSVFCLCGLFVVVNVSCCPVDCVFGGSGCGGWSGAVVVACCVVGAERVVVLVGGCVFVGCCCVVGVWCVVGRLRAAQMAVEFGLLPITTLGRLFLDIRSFITCWNEPGCTIFSKWACRRHVIEVVMEACMVCA